ncbi:MAG: glycosyltransferase [Bacteroidales bacterium]|nr:glycosyltransferase [Bacteroidales bacterium]
MYKKYNADNFYVSISNADRSPELDYMATVYNGINSGDFTFSPVAKEYLLFFGRIHPDKGTCEAIQIAKKSGRQLIISGLVQDEAYFEQKVKPFINNEDIVYVGNSGAQERDELLGNALALLHPIRFNEPFGLSVAEAMFCGTPVIAFNRGSMPELIEDAKSGFLVDTIEEAVHSVSLLQSIDRAYCCQWASSKFSREKMIEGYLKVYNKIL